MAGEVRENNWPFGRSKASCYHQDIAGEIPEGALRRLVYFAYFMWMGTVVTLAYNLICALCLMSQGELKNLIVAIIFAVIWPVFTHWVFRCLYNAARSNGTLRFFLFFGGLLAEIILNIIAVIGITGWGFAGIVYAISAKHAWLQLMCLVCAILWGILIATSVYLWIHTRVVYSQRGGLRATAAEAGKAAVTEAAKHPDVVVAVATEAAKQQVEQQQQQPGGGAIL
eukprot:m51a1_g11883 putative secretory carrier-associated membrane protein 3-like (226) ;mRNA; r:577869-578783